MPTYEYLCSSCHNAWEEIQKISEPALEECPKCHQKTARRQISGGNFILKGGGWYADLYSSTKPAAKGEGSSGSSDTKSDSKAPVAKETSSTAPAASTASPSTAPAASSGSSKD